MYNILRKQISLEQAVCRNPSETQELSPGNCNIQTCTLVHFGNGGFLLVNPFLLSFLYFSIAGAALLHGEVHCT